MSACSRMPVSNVLIAVVVGFAVGVGTVVVLRHDPSGEKTTGSPDSLNYNIEPYQTIDPQLVRYRQQAEIPTGMQDARAVAVGPADAIYVAGDRAIRVFDVAGKTLREIALDESPHCLAIGGAEHVFPGRVYVGMRDHVETYSADGVREAVWQRPAGNRTTLTSIAAASEDVFVADAGTPVVWRYDVHGTLLGAIGRRDAEREILGFVVPSPYFDVAVAPDGLLRVANPGLHRIEAFTFDGHQELFWGKRGMDIDAFCGCCNPSNIAILADGRVVTAEKGIPRVKVHRESGEFESVVTGPDVLAPRQSATVETREDLRPHPVDVAADSGGRIVVLDPNAGCVRIFVQKEATSP